MKKTSSIRLRYTLIFALILGATIALSVVMNSLFLEKYYNVTKQRTMLSVCEELSKLLKEYEESGGEPEDEAAEAEPKNGSENGGKSTEKLTVGPWEITFQTGGQLHLLRRQNWLSVISVWFWAG